MKIIVAIAENNAIGKAGELLCYLPDDLKHFKALTTGATVVMGKKTFFSLPRRPLPNRRNIVLTREENFTYDNTEVAHSIEELQSMIAANQTVFIIGGGEVYRQLMPFANELHITHIHHTWEDADTFFPEIDTTIWQCIDQEHHKVDERHAYAYTFATYKKLPNKQFL
ncbi:MAG: dihydrofolate reductase [Paludibacteraceae bacterium]|nr:dihydrofolate reductase [Paludibacteraceae bacterium]